MNSLPPLLPDLKIRIDWKAYFLEFMRVHGKAPVNYHKRLLFPDGWRYSAQDHAGPEWPPPTDPKAKRQLVLDYWNIRYGIVKEALKGIEQNLQGLTALQGRLSAPLQQTWWSRDEDTGLLSKRSDVLDLGALAQRVTFLQEDLAECLVKIESFTKPQEIADAIA